MTWLKRITLWWLGLTDNEARLVDLERHFVTKRDDKGAITETLADVPVHLRKQIKPGLRGATWQQRKAWNEATDGGRKSG